MTFHHERRLHRAIHHLEDLKVRRNAWLRKRPYRIWTDLDSGGTFKFLWVEVLDRPGPEFGLIIGDCLHNLRSALDNLVYELALTYTGIDPLPENRARLLEFPIFGVREMNPRECRNKIGCIDPRAQTAIKGLQPYNRGQRFTNDPLWKLQQLSNIDKHRLPHIALFARVASPSFWIPGDVEADEIEPITFTVEDRAPIARYPAFDQTGAEVNVDLTPAFDIGFGQQASKRLRGTSVYDTLMRIHNYITNDVVPPLTSYLT